jgi:hypothetical protein
VAWLELYRAQSKFDPYNLVSADGPHAVGGLLLRHLVGAWLCARGAEYRAHIPVWDKSKRDDFMQIARDLREGVLEQQVSFGSATSASPSWNRYALVFPKCLGVLALRHFPIVRGLNAGCRRF